MVHYARAVDHIKKRRFEVEVPAFYHPFMPDDIVNPKPRVSERLAPGKRVKRGLNGVIVLPPVEDPNQLQRASYTIEIMLDMFNKKIEFSLMQTFDIVEILDSIDRYLISIQRDVESGNQKVVEYARVLVKWRDEVYKHYFRYMKQNPAAAARLYANNDPKKNFFSLMSTITGNDEEHRDLDPLRAKAYPPYPIDRNADKSEVTAGEVMMETSLGIPDSAINKMLNGEDNKFDFDDFLGRR